MRVLHVISGIDPRLGGTANLLAGLTTAQARVEGLEVAVATVFAEGENHAVPAADLRARGVSVIDVGPVTGRLRRHPGLTRMIDGAVSRSDVVHVHGLWEEIQHLAARSARRHAVPYVIAPQGMLDPWSLNQSRWVKKLYMLWRLRRNLNRATAIQFTAELERDLTAPLGLRAPAIIEPNGIDLSEYDDLPPRGAARRRHDVPTGTMLLFLSRLHPKKGLDLLIPAFARADLSHDATLVIAGPPDSAEYESHLRGLVKEHDIGRRVIFTGMLYGKDRLALMADADLFVLPSYQENFGIVVAEALACGTPVLISDGINIYKEIQSAGVGGVCEPELNSVTRELKRWGSDAELRRSAASKAAAFARERYDWNAIAARWKGHYEKLITAAKRGGIRG
jgi:glycosyltransferase involved in cell wall biosynthesis